MLPIATKYAKYAHCLGWSWAYNFPSVSHMKQFSCCLATLKAPTKETFAQWKLQVTLLKCQIDSFEIVEKLCCLPSKLSLTIINENVKLNSRKPKLHEGWTWPFVADPAIGCLQWSAHSFRWAWSPHPGPGCVEQSNGTAQPSTVGAPAKGHWTSPWTGAGMKIEHDHYWFLCLALHLLNTPEA